MATAPRVPWSALALWAAFTATVIGSNLAVVHIGLLPVWPGISAPAGVYLVGLALVLRDLLQEATSWRWSAVAVVVGAGLSAVVSPALALASAVTFLASELLDLAVYTPLRRRGLVLAVTASNAVGLLADSLLFLWLAFGSLEFLTGQVLGKTWMTVAAVVVLLALREVRTRARRDGDRPPRTGAAPRPRS